jgi:hypothetical protein
MFGDVYSTSCGRMEIGTLNILRYGDEDVNIISNTLFLIVTLHFHHETYFGVGGSFNYHID